MDIREIGLPQRIVDLLIDAGLETVEAVWGAGDLTSIAGVGAKTAEVITAALSPVPDAVDPPGTELSPLRWVSVRNDGSGPVVVGNTYLYPGEARTVRAAHAPAGLPIKELPDGN